MIAAVKSWNVPLFGGLDARTLVERVYHQLKNHELIMRSSAITYYALTAFVPFLAVVITFAAHFSPKLTGDVQSRDITGTTTVEEFRQMLARFLPPESYELVAGEIARLQANPPIGLLSVSLAVSIWLSSGAFGAFVTAVDAIHGVKETRSYLRLTLTAIVITLVEAFIIIGTLVALIVWPRIRHEFAWIGLPSSAEILAEWSIVILGLLLSYAIITRFGPNLHRGWRPISPGAVMSTVAFMASGLLLRVYVLRFGGYGRTYGSLAGAMLLAFWFWISAIILLVSIQIDKIIDDAKENLQS